MIWNSGCHSPPCAARRLPPPARHGPRSARRASRCRACRAYARCRAPSRAASSSGCRNAAPSAALRALEHCPGHEQIAGGRAGGEDFARVDAVAALHLLGLAGAGDPVRPAARQQTGCARRRCASAAAPPRPPSGASSARPESPPDACAWRMPVRSSRNDRPACAAWRPVRRCRLRRRQARAARPLRPGRTF